MNKGYKDTPPEITLFSYVEAYFHNGNLVVLDDMTDEELNKKKDFHDNLRKHDTIFQMKRRATPAEMEEHERQVAEEEAAKAANSAPIRKIKAPVFSF